MNRAVADELPILEETDARKVILLSPRGGLKLGLGCAVSCGWSPLWSSASRFDGCLKRLIFGFHESV